MSSDIFLDRTCWISLEGLVIEIIICDTFKLKSGPYEILNTKLKPM